MMRLLALLFVGLVACAHRSPQRVETVADRDEPALGLYVVDSYEVSNPLDLPEKWWEQTRYVELSRGPFFNTPNGQTAIVFWTEPSTEGERFFYRAHELRGHFEGSLFVGPEDPLGRQSLMVDDTKSLVRLHHERFRSDTNHEVVVDVVFKLRRVERTPELDRLLQPGTEAE
ncbi:MAG: hypothetical protein JWN48_1405 [Myxococcaceae bacterium]|nr:hypothetical protein [Myxococcaceae bacterium]